ncbi:MAG: glycogen-binding domain-containing protein [Parafilimonas sp.]
MKHNNNSPSEIQPALQSVHFAFTAPNATTVCIAGTFDNWQPEAMRMHSIPDGGWVKEAKLAPGTYEYCLVVDGKYIPDPKALGTVSNPFGGRNSVLTVGSSVGATHLADAENLPLKCECSQKNESAKKPLSAASSKQLSKEGTGRTVRKKSSSPAANRKGQIL